jgi:hypothetical protein
MEPDRIAWLALVVLGLVVAVGMLAVRTSGAEVTRLSAVFPGAQLFQYRAVRVIIALASFGIAIVGVAGLMGKLD